MNKVALLLIVCAAFISAAAFRYIENAKVISPEETKATINRQKAFSIKCSPLYIPTEEDAIPVLTGWGNYSWKISTTSDSAQFYFNQGINMYYAFHIIEARASFDKATRFDPSCAMAWWAKALAFGPNINDFGYQRPSEALSSAAKAKELAGSATALERYLITAIQPRYSADTTVDQKLLNEHYVLAMEKVYQENKSNADVTALYADALMLLHPWDLYDQTSQPKVWTPKIVQVIKHGLALNPAHPGANHYYVHAVEASTNPKDALKSADMLSLIMPDVSHITHMGSHIYIRTGNYKKGIEVNDRAVSGFAKYRAMFPSTAENIMLYSLHNLHMKVNNAQMAGNYQKAILASEQLSKEIPAFYLAFPGAVGNIVQYLDQPYLLTQVRFGKWNNILQTSIADTLSYSPVLQHFAKGLAFSRLSQSTAAVKEHELMLTRMKNESLKEPATPFSSAYDAALVAEKILAGVIAEEQKNYAEAIKLLEEAVAYEDKIIYNEPRDWLLPARQYLGNALLKAGRYQQAAEVFKKDLFINPANGWSLTGLQLAAKLQHQTKEVASLNKSLSKAWIIKDVTINSPVF